MPPCYPGASLRSARLRLMRPVGPQEKNRVSPVFTRENGAYC